ncbi:hypothetical protein DFH08DRAFT_820382 [Mycena albidolilacea]|uniref:DUF6532 domain-containing protein n=1 Tax=Mycena albidolilacea TaxID=1033008 RepID=A0AAD6ZCZ5_9AGAR|nr:hypothetical protein DFH08DRAFT_820382 [Mycena albidolilacea]
MLRCFTAKWPEWNDPQPSVSRASGQHSCSHHPSITIKHEYAEPVHIKAEPEDGTLTSTGGSDDINLRKNSQGTLNLTKQHPDVQNVLGLAIDYFLGFYLLKCASYLDLRVKTTIYQDALMWSAQDLKLPLLQTRLQEDADYRSGLSMVLFGHISIWRGKVKTAAHQVVYGHYQVQHDCAGLVTRLLDKQSFIYPTKLIKLTPGHMKSHTVNRTKGGPTNTKVSRLWPVVSSRVLTPSQNTWKQCLSAMLLAILKPLNQWLHFPASAT